MGKWGWAGEGVTGLGSPARSPECVISLGSPARSPERVIGLGWWWRLLVQEERGGEVRVRVGERLERWVGCNWRKREMERYLRGKIRG